MTLTWLQDRYAVCRCTSIPAVPPSAAFWSLSITEDEISVVCDEASIPEGSTAQDGWVAFRIRGQIAFDVIGVIASLTKRLAEAGVSIFVCSTFDTDYVLVRAEDKERSITALSEVAKFQ